MCGIAGVILKSSVDQDYLRDCCGRMTDALRHRGPDSSGIFIDSNRCVALGHRRLSILDLSRAGNQPMESHCGRWVITFNGEIYNYRRIQKELEQQGYPFSFVGTSDTEVMLAAISFWGLKAALQKFIGMFAFGLWDKVDGKLCLARDRVGIKPLYYGWGKSSFLFGSELRALAANADFNCEIDLLSVNSYFKNLYVPAPQTIYKNAYELCPGKVLTLDCQQLEKGVRHCDTIEPFWSAFEIYSKGQKNRFKGTEDDALCELERLLRDSISLRMISDVPIGVFLSGGIDSSVVVSIMQALGSSPVKSFTIGFHEAEFDESKYASRVARHLGTNHHELILTQTDCQALIPDLVSCYDEPFADSSLIPTTIVSRFARERVKVALTGDGGDELMVGYPRYFDISAYWRILKIIPAKLRDIVSSSAISTDGIPRHHPYHSNPSLAGVFSEFLSRQFQRISKFTYYASASSLEDLYKKVCENVKPQTLGLLVKQYQHDETHPKLLGMGLDQLDDLEALSLIDFVQYLPYDLLTKVDRASMSVGLEARVPMLDHRIVEFTATLPISMKVSKRSGKKLTRLLAEKCVPKEYLDRPKKGFSIPLDDWLRGDLKSWFTDVLESRSDLCEELVNEDFVRLMTKEHVSRERDWGAFLWSYAIFKYWALRRR